MSNVKTLTSLAAASLLATGLSACASQAPSFEAKPMKQGYQNTQKHAEGKCGGHGKQADGKCGAQKKTNSKCSDGKCGGKADKHADGKCGASKPKHVDGKCGEGKCGGKTNKQADGKCGASQ
ncbi:MAG: hypothetical protein Q4A69_03720 [Moraxella sp.]|nr:hypothetical protein [Moraxella sp.]